MSATCTPEIQFDVKALLIPGDGFENSEIDASFVDSASPSEGPDWVLDAFFDSFPPGYLAGLFGEKEGEK
jgi:hypothetical protein